MEITRRKITIIKYFSSLSVNIKNSGRNKEFFTTNLSFINCFFNGIHSTNLSLIITKRMENPRSSLRQYGNCQIERYRMNVDKFESIK